MVGEKPIQGKADFAQALARVTDNQALELTIHHVVTHGKAGVVNGMLKLKSGETRAFCDMVEFNGAKGTRIREIMSYVIETK